MKTKLIFITSIFLLITNCGFNIVNQNYLSQYNIIENEITGDNRVSYLLKNKLKIKNNEAKKSIKLEINLDKDKKIKEKNIQNEVTKYEIILLANVKFQVPEDNKIGNFVITQNGNYVVNDKYSITLENEKILIKDLVNNLSQKIIENLSIKLNDF